MKTLFILFIIICIIKVIYSDSQPTILTIQGTIFDQYPLYNDNFEPQSGSLTTGMVLSTINTTTRTPTLVSQLKYTTANVNGRMVSPQLYQYFYQSNQEASKTVDSGLNVPIAMTINLTLDSSTGTYIYDNQYFFPIDKQGFDVDPYYRNYTDGKNYHNFHFCLKLNSRFTYSGVEIFNFIGDDDVWVFINDQLVVDLGGLHTAQSKSIDLTTLGLIKNKVYTFDFFYCERHTTQSTIRIETTIQAYCPFYDYCGVCYGDGSTCCSSKTCDDGNPCTTDVCPPATTTISTGNLVDYCQHIPISCPYINACINNTCNIKTGSCSQNAVECIDKSDQCLAQKTCDISNGCVYETTCSNICNTGVCNNGVCATKSNSTCATEMGNDVCKNYHCEANGGGCKATPKCPQGNDPCIQAICTNGVCSTKQLNASECQCGCELNKCQKNNCNGASCVPLPLDEIDDGNPCTIDTCDNSTGVITHTLTTKCSGCMTCNTTTGGCSPIANTCQDGNECTDNICQVSASDSNHGVCQNSTAICPSQDKCKTYTCDTNKGCISSDVVCPNSGNCMVGVCNSQSGCTLEPRNCNSTSYCVIGECDESVGCISFARRCSPDNAKCQSAVCINGTNVNDGECKSVDYDPQPFICKTAAVVSTAVVAGVVVAGAVALGAAIFAGKKGYDYWKTNQGNTMAASNANPLYEANPAGGENPLFQSPQ